MQKDFEVQALTKEKLKNLVKSKNGIWVKEELTPQQTRALLDACADKTTFISEMYNAMPAHHLQQRGNTLTIATVRQSPYASSLLEFSMAQTIIEENRGGVTLWLPEPTNILVSIETMFPSDSQLFEASLAHTDRDLNNIILRQIDEKGLNPREIKRYCQFSEREKLPSLTVKRQQQGSLKQIG